MKSVEDRLSHQELSYTAFGKRLYEAAFRERRPISGTIALTYSCNLRCVHCYLQDQRECCEISNTLWLPIIDQLQKAGCLWLVITGGEPLLRPDFSEIYCHAKRLGMLVTVFTNGTLVDDTTVALFKRWPPLEVEITLYGYTPETYQAVTGNSCAHQTAFEAVERLMDIGTPLCIKTMAIKQNNHEIDKLREFCRDRNVRFRYDTLISPTLDGCKDPCETSLSTDSILELDQKDAKRRQALHKALVNAEHRNPVRHTLFNCGAGMSSFFINPSGMLCTCIIDLPLYDLTRGDFLTGWHGPVLRRRQTPLPVDHPCRNCVDQAFCGVCPPLARAETGSDFGIPTSLCHFGKRRKLAFSSV